MFKHKEKIKARQRQNNHFYYSYQNGKSNMLVDPNLHRKIQTFRNSAKSLMLPCSLGLTGPDPQGGISTEAMCKFLSLNLPKVVITYFLNFIKRK